MFSELVQWIQKNRAISLAIIAGLVVFVSAFVQPQWWGERSVGVLIGVGVLVFAVFVLFILEENSSLSTRDLVPWAVIIVSIATALFLRRSSGGPIPWPIQIHLPALPSAKNILAVLAAAAFLILIWKLFRGLSRGERVAIESHWGGLGGGLGGWYVSSPLVYLMGIVVLIALAATWWMLPPQEVTQTQTGSASQQPPAPAAKSPTQNPTPTPTP